MLKIFRYLLFVFLCTGSLVHASDDSNLVEWKAWNKQAFSQAKKQQKLIMLDLEAVWCHWCHVMDQKTYANTAVANYLNKNFISIKVDQDSRPDLALKYKDYGWPATIFFDSNGTEIVKRAGYISPDRMLALLNAIVEDPSPETNDRSFEISSSNPETSLNTDIKAQLISNHTNSLDLEVGGLKIFQKYIDVHSMEYSLNEILKGNKQDEAWVLKTLDNALQIQDPVWGGFYQYSTFDDWQHPHFEKIMKFQARYIKLYAFAYSIYKDPKYLKAATNTASYLTSFLMDKNGTFYVSQDADLIKGQHSDSYFDLNDRQRRKLGIPKVDTSIYARENGWAIEAFAYLYEVTQNRHYLNSAVLALKTMEDHWFSEGLGFSHKRLSTDNRPRIYLADNIAMGKAYLQLYRATSKRQYLAMASNIGSLINDHFYEEKGSFKLAQSDGTPIDYSPQLNESIDVARLFAMLYHVSGKKEFLDNAKHAMKYLSMPSVAFKNISDDGILLADNEISQLPLHITIVGSKKSDKAKQLFADGLLIPSMVKRIEWWDRKDGKLMNEDVLYPYLEKPSAFVCTNKICSLPLTTGKQLSDFALTKLKQ